MTAKRVLLRLAMSLALLFMVFWTFAYILYPPGVGALPWAARFDGSKAWSWPSLIAAVLLAVWVAMAFRSN